ncbi:thiopurine S-methyltransferase [Psychrobacter pacificensis]|uniref:Thiopurine S-methyltransferase n=1 Tax=Psychrobacter pacificensis TaxID=112002 RepID=A0A1G6YNT3_9GAMM|nr:thiopurine S-methyltransferase [Psychrobacter pacificensis]GLR29644.1 thiopurine S-methyltransferase [Psychrobacter pacificensis]SDD91196.1 thiopurine S-methyltransferase [Psychrobacter pacificensis]
MNPEFWHKRWQEKRIGFNQSAVNPLLTEYIDHLDLAVGSRIFVPLCGKSIDMVWLAAQGYDVVGVELVETAVQAFFAEQNIQPIVSQHLENPDIKCYQGQLVDGDEQRTITLWAADIFALTSTDLGTIDAIYDKAALIALPADMRPDYSEQIRKVSDNAPQLLITLNYDQSKKDGPPFSINHEQVQQYYGSHYQICKLASEPSSIGSAPNLKVTEHIWLLK